MTLLAIINSLDRNKTETKTTGCCFDYKLCLRLKPVRLQTDELQVLFYR